MSLWGVGGGMLIYLSGLQNIPTILYEAASIDGASSWQKLRNVTVPMLTPVIFFNLIMGVIGSLQVFTSSFIMTNGGRANRQPVLRPLPVPPRLPVLPHGLRGQPGLDSARSSSPR